jgi:hypothetical protein
MQRRSFASSPGLVSQPGLRDQPFSFQNRLKEIGMFFQGTDAVHQTMNKIAADLVKAHIPYAIVGGMAVNAHRHGRTTDDVDVLLTEEGFAQFRRLYVPKTYGKVPKRSKRFLDPTNGVTFDILVTGLFPGTGKPGPISYPDPAAVSETIENIRVVGLPTLIQLKLAAGRHQDYADVVNLIRVHDLDESFQARLHPAVQRDYIECLEEKRREEEYEARQDEEFERKVGGDKYEPDES